MGPAVYILTRTCTGPCTSSRIDFKFTGLDCQFPTCYSSFALFQCIRKEMDFEPIAAKTKYTLYIIFT